MANVAAKVELTGSMSHTYAGHILKRGTPQIVTNPSLIAYYRAQKGISVTILEKAKAPPPPAIQQKKQVEDEDESGVDGEESGAQIRQYAESELKMMTKAQLTEIALEYALAVDDSTKKADIVAAIIESQS